MKAKYAVLTAMLCVMCFLVGARFGVQDAHPEPEEIVKTVYVDVPTVTETVVTYEYIPLPVDYDPVLDVETIDETDAVLLAKTLWGEYRDSSNYAQCAAVCWCVLNRVDADGFGNTVKEVVTAPNQFQGYSERNPVDAELYNIAVDVLLRWQCEDRCCGDIGRVIGEDFLWFEAAPGMVNAFRNAYRGGERIVP